MEGVCACHGVVLQEGPAIHNTWFLSWNIALCGILYGIRSDHCVRWTNQCVTAFYAVVCLCGIWVQSPPESDWNLLENEKWRKVNRNRWEWFGNQMGINGMHFLKEEIMRWILNPMMGIFGRTHGKLSGIYVNGHPMEWVSGYGSYAGSYSV